MEISKTKCRIRELPSEIISTILQYADIQDIIAFSATCYYYNDMIKNLQMLWKIKFQIMMPPDIFFMVERDCKGGNWFDQVKKFHTVKQEVYSELLAMSPKYFWRDSNIPLSDVRRFFTISLASNMNYYYTIYLLQEVVTNGAMKTGLWEGRIPYTMTEMHYAKVVLCHLMHSFLAVKWAQKYIKEELLPQAVLTFFLQWIDPASLYMEDDVDHEINNLVRDVEMLIFKKPENSLPGETIKKQLAEKNLKERQVINAISQILYQYRQIVVTYVIDIDTLSIPQILKKKSGHMIAVASIFHAVAHRCGLKCDVIAFPNHFFLKWKCNDNERHPQVYKIDIASGEVRETPRCPFSALPANSSSKYCANSLLRFIITSFSKPVEPANFGAHYWYKQNAFLLFELFNPESVQDSPYYNYLHYLTQDAPLNSLSPINIKYIENEHIQIISTLTYLNAPLNICENSRSFAIKKRSSKVKYAVGMICFNTKYLYTGIIVGWDPICEVRWSQDPEVWRNLQYGPKQPFYHVVAAGESSRYVAQENLVPVTNPQRLIHLEDLIAREFTHFNGFAYVPNKEKKIEYPEDAQISEMFLSRAESKVGISLTNPLAMCTHE